VPDHDPDILEALNPVQREAVTHHDGPLLVVAGAGSGKTRVLTHRIAHLIRDHHISPFEILAITFTNKAAAEMKQRVAALVGPVADKMWVSTFHSACVRILRRDAGKLGFPSSFTIYDQADAVRLTSYVIRDLALDPKKFPPRSVHGSISMAKNDNISASAFRERAGAIFERKIADVYVEYQERLRKAGAMDFDDLLMVTARLFREQPDVLEHYRHRFKHVLVDEYQDTNKVQNELVIQLAGEHRNICVVGDSDQCLPSGTLISTSRGAVPIESIAVGDVVRGTTGKSQIVEGRVTGVKPGNYSGRLYRVRAGDRELEGTPHHIVLARQVLQSGQYLVYLMYRADRGYRVGVTKSMRPAKSGSENLGIQVRVNQEHADAAWILRVVDTSEEAAYWEAYYSSQYGLPTVCFHTLGRKLSLTDDDLARLFGAIDTTSRAKALMDDLDLHPEFPHHRPANGKVRQTLNLTMFSDIRSNKAYHRVQWSSNRTDIGRRLQNAGFSVRPGKLPGTVRYETSRMNYRDALALATRVAEAGGLKVRRRAAIGGVMYDYTPLSHLRPGMAVLVEVGDRLEERRVDDLFVEDYDGPVYDLEVDPTHTYVANGVLVHNSVYRFRGADIRNILEFEEAFPDTTVIVLEQNYRSTQTILDAANAVIANNFGRKPKELWTDSGAGQAIVRYHADDESDESQWVAHEISRLHDEGERWGDVAVFYRTNAMSRVIEDQLMRLGIPYKVVGGTRFYDRREVKDALAYMRAVVNPVDEVSVKRVINVPKRGIGDSTVGKLDAWATARGVAFIDALRRADEAGVQGRAVKGIAEFLALLDELDEARSEGPGRLLELVLERTGYVAELQAEHSIESEGRLENLAELVGVAREFDNVDEFLEQVSLIADTDELPEGADDTSVVLMTLHAAKGLEFPSVFLVGMEDGVFPHLRSLGEPAELEEERRLAYVGITRARERLYLTNTWSRMLYGSTQYNPPSRFLDEIPMELVQHAEGSRETRTRQRESFGSGGWTSSVRRNRDEIVERALRPQGPVKHGAEVLGLRVGDDVRHAKWGEGVIIDIEGQGEKAEATVRFPDVGEKRLLLSWAPLEKLQP
jgi:DNA helicase II / ATP-dependent DNA helicase PcrA